MATPKLLFTNLRRSRRLLSLSYYSHLSNSTRSNPKPQIHSFNNISSTHFLNYRYFSSSHPNNYDFDSLNNSASTELQQNVTELVGAGANIDPETSILPVRLLISALDGFHNFTGLPWWIVIVSTTVAMRVTLFPLLVLQLNKLKTIQEFFPKLPPPFPPLLSGKSYVAQFKLFDEKRKAIGCPSYFWFIAYVSFQIPCFLLWMTSIRRMSMDHHPGFDCGGALWFQNLTEYSHGISGPIFPLLIACLHYINIQLAFEKSSLQETNGLLGLLLNYYKKYLDLLTIPLFFIGYCVPQGNLVYWVTNSSMSFVQQASLKHTGFRAKLGLPSKESPATSADSVGTGTPQASLDTQSKDGLVSVETLNPKQLLTISTQLLNNKHVERAIPLLQLALQKDPNYTQALVLMGQALMQKKMYADAEEHLERAISKLFVDGKLAEIKEVDLLILASQWSGVACIRQGKNAEAIVHFGRVANLEEPEDANSRVHYFTTLVYLASALYNEGRKAEAANYLRVVVAFDPKCKEMLEMCENENDDDGDDIGSDLINSRRKDY